MPNTVNQPFVNPRFADPKPGAPDQPIVKTPVQARGGVTGHGVHGVLLWSTLGVIVLFALILWYSLA